MTIAQGISKKVIYKKESTWGVPAGTSGGKTLRRVTSAFNLTKEAFQSEEIRTDYQMVDFRHGVRMAEGSINGEISPGTYSDFFAAALMKAFVNGGSSTGLNLTIAASGMQYTLTRDTGSFITDGFRVGDVIQIDSATGLNADSINKNLLITSLTGLVATVSVLNGSSMTPAAGTAASVAVKGKKTWIPQTGQVFDSFTVEEFFEDIGQSEVYTGLKVNTIGVSIPASGMATVDFALMGKDLSVTGTSQYFVSPSSQGTSGTLTGVNGVVVFNGMPVAVITDASLNVNRNITNATVLGSNSIADSFEGRALVDGSLSLYFTDTVARDAFKDETEVSLVFAMSTSNLADADFVSITLPRVKINSFQKDDSEGGLVASADFQALLNPVAGALEVTTIVVQDSLAV